MLKSMRKNVKSLAPTLWFVIAAFIISIFAVWGGGLQLGEGKGTNILAAVGKTKISTELYLANLRQQLETLRRQFQDLDSNLIQQLNLPQQVLEQLIQQSLILQAAQDLGVEATDEELRTKIKGLSFFQKDGKFVGFEEYQRTLEWNRISVPDFEEGLKKEILIDKVIQASTAGVAVTERELWEDYQRKKESAKLEYVILEINKLDLPVEFSRNELQDYFEKNKGKYRIPEKREGVFVLFDTEELRKEVELNPAEIEKYYQANKSQFAEPEKMRLSRIYLAFAGQAQEEVLARAKACLEEARSGADFAELAKKYSQDEKAQEAGDWGFFDWKKLTAREQEEAGKLEQGSLSGLIQLEDGVSIVKVTEKEPALQKSLEEVKDRVNSIMKDQKARDLAERRATQLKKNGEKEKNLDKAAQKLDYLVEKTAALKEGEALGEDDPSGMISLSLFKLQDKEISSLIYTHKGVGVAQLEKVWEPRAANFEEVEEEVREGLEETAKKQKAVEKISEVRMAAASSSLEKQAEIYSLEYKTAEEHKRGQYLSIIGENPEVDRLAFSLPLEETSEPLEFKDGYALIRILGRTEVTRENFEKDRDTQRQSVLDTKRNEFFQSYLSQLRAEKGVKVKYDLFFRISSDILSRYRTEPQQ